MKNAVTRPGLAFVGWTRATTWSKVAFQSLPPLEEFLAIRLQQDFKARSTFESTADALHDALLLSRGITEEMQIREHHDHFKAVLVEKEQRQATDAELQDISTMLQQRGVAPVSDSVLHAFAQQSGGLVGKVCGTLSILFALTQNFNKEARQASARKELNSLIVSK